MRTVFVLGALLISSNAAAQELRCDIQQKFVCENTGCKPAPVAVWNVIDLIGKKYTRCDRSGCDTYNAEVSRSGEFINVDVLGRGLTAKIGQNSSTFHESASLMNQVYVSFGACKPN